MADREWPSRHRAAPPEGSVVAPGEPKEHNGPTPDLDAIRRQMPCRHDSALTCVWCDPESTYVSPGDRSAPTPPPTVPDERLLRKLEEFCPNRCGRMQRNAEGFWQCPECECISVTRYIDHSDFEDYPHGIIR